MRRGVITNFTNEFLFKHQVSLLGKKHGHMVKLVSSSGNPFSYLPNAQIWHWPELLPSACRPRSPALEEYSAQSLKSPQAIPSSSASYGHHLQAQVCCPSAWTTRFACKASICSTTLWSSVPAKPPLLGDPSPLITDCSARAAHRCSQTYGHRCRVHSWQEGGSV